MIEDEQTSTPSERGLIEFEAWLVLTPKLIGRGTVERLELLAEQDIEPEDWDAAEQRWSMAIALDYAAGRSGRPERYVKACAEEMAARREAASGNGADEHNGGGAAGRAGDEDQGSAGGSGRAAEGRGVARVSAAAPTAEPSAEPNHVAPMAGPSGEPNRAALMAGPSGEPNHSAETASPKAPSVDQTAWMAPVVTETPALPFDCSAPARTPGPLVQPTDERPDLAGETVAVPTVSDDDEEIR